MSRATATALATVTCMLAVTCLLLPWWETTSYIDGSRRSVTHPYGAFNRGETGGRNFETDVVVLGVLVSATALLAALAAFLYSRGGTGGPILMLLAALCSVAAVSYVFLAFPDALRAGPGDEDLDFFDKKCTPGVDNTVCQEAAPGWGWYAGMITGIVALVGAASSGRTRRAPRPAGTVPASTPLAVDSMPAKFNPLARVRGVAPGTTERTKCSRCQTWLSYTRNPHGETTVTCHNCGHRFAG